MLETECIDIINKFPMILKQVLEEEPSLREEIKQYYRNRTYDDKQTVYRIITREVGNNNIIITKEDFYTNIKKIMIQDKDVLKTNWKNTVVQFIVILKS